MAGRTLQGSDGVMKALEDIAKRMGGGEVSVGFMEGATYPEGTPVAAVAFWNEYGVPSHNQPPRPFFRQMIAAESPTWPGKMAKLAKAADYDGDRVLALMGEDIGAGLVQSIRDLETPELAESTKEKKGFSKPLIDTNVMRRAVNYKVNSDSPMPIPGND